MKRSLRITVYVLIGVLVAVALLVGTFFLLTRTDVGLERVRAFAVDRIEEAIQGEVRLGRITTPGILGRAKLHDVAIDDPEGRPFLRADSVLLLYDWRTLLGGQFVFERLELYDAEAYITRMPGDTAWNYEYIFADTTPDEGPDDLILLERAVVHNSLVEVRYPWEPEEPPAEAPPPAVRERVVDEPGLERKDPPGDPPDAPADDPPNDQRDDARDDARRVILESVPGGVVRVLRFEDIDAALPRVLWSTPVEEGRLFRIAALSTRGYVWAQPFDLRNLEGTVTLRDSLLAFDASAVRLPDSRASMVGQVITGDGGRSYDVRIAADDIAFADLQWLYPRLPDEGGGNLVFRINTLAPGRTLWLATDAHLRTPGTEIAGDFGIVTGDTLYFTRVDLRASPLDVDLIERVTPADLPIEGLMVGTVEVEGPLSALDTRGDVRVIRRGGDGGTAVVSWNGVIDARRRVPRRLTADVTRADPALLAALRPGWRPSGEWSGHIEVSDSGGDDRSLRLAASVRNLLDQTATSGIEVEGRVLRPVRGRPTVDVEVRSTSLAIRTLSALVPGVESLQGELRGELRVTGSADDMEIDGRVHTAGGPVELRGRLDLTGDSPDYRLHGRFTDYHPTRLTGRGPPTAMTGSFDVVGVGTGPRRARGEARLSIEAARVGELEVTDAVAGITLDDGVARIDTLDVRARAGRLTARGAFGLVPERSGRIDLDLRVDSLSAFRSFVLADTLLIDGDEDRSAETAFGGGLRLTGFAAGGIGEFDAELDVSTRDLIYRSLHVRRATASFDGRAIGGDQTRFGLTVRVDTAATDRRSLDEATVEASWTEAAGAAAIAGSGPDGRTYRLDGEFRRAGETTVVALQELRLADTATVWSLERPATVRIDPTVLEVAEARLVRADGVGRVTISGRIPNLTPLSDRTVRAEQPVDFRVDAEGVQIGRVLRLTQSAPIAAGGLRGRLAITGTAGAPRIEGDAVVRDMRIDSLAVGETDADFTYEDRRLDARVSMLLDGRRILDGGGSIPLDLALMPVAERRLAEPLEFEFETDRVPAVLVTSLVPGLEGVEGELDGGISIGGTARDPVLDGALELRDAAVTWQPSGVRYREVEGTFRVLSDRVIGVDVQASAGTGSATVAGFVTFGSLDDPAFDLVLDMDGFSAVRRAEVDAVASGRVRLGGRYREPVVTGRIQLDRGTLYLDQIVRNRRIIGLDDLDDPFLQNVLDAARFGVEQIVPATERSPFLRNLVLRDATVSVSRDFWLRGRNMDVELVGDLNVTYDRQREDLRLSGLLNAVRGSYQLRITDLYTRAFTIRDGTVEFVGTPGLDPNLNLTGRHRVRTANGDPLDILAQVTGTLREPRVRLASNSEPPISESELVSYLVFGRPTFALGPGESSAIDRLGLEAVSPAFLHPIASGLESALGLDYLAVTSTDVAGTPGGSADGGFLDDLRAEVELGRYLQPDLFVAVTSRIGRSGLGGAGGDTGLSGVRVEWRFRPTWMLELFREDRFARYPSFDTDATLRARFATGFFLAREWGF